MEKQGQAKVVVLEALPTCFLLADGSAGSQSNSVTRTDVIYNLARADKLCALAFKPGF